MCLFLDESENILLKLNRLKFDEARSQDIELKKVKIKHNSLYKVITLQFLEQVTQEAINALYLYKPGCLDRLI
jgi:hypothetical protein